MRHDQLFFSWLVRCGSEEQARSIRQELEANPLTSITFSGTVHAFRGDSRIKEAQPRVVGDYFVRVNILPEESPGSFQLVFQRKPAAPRHWKDVMMYVLRMARDEGARSEAWPVEIVLKYRGDVYPPPESGL